MAALKTCERFGHVMLSEAKHPCISLKTHAEILRCAQDDMSSAIFTFRESRDVREVFSISRLGLRT
jgi:hypothetical protein